MTETASNVHYLYGPPAPIEPLDEVAQEVAEVLNAAGQAELSDVVVVGLPRDGGRIYVRWKIDEGLPGVDLMLSAAKAVIANTFLDELASFQPPKREPV